MELFKMTARPQRLSVAPRWLEGRLQRRLVLACGTAYHRPLNRPQKPLLAVC